MTEEIDQLCSKFALAIPEQESAETPPTIPDQSVTLTAEPTADVTAECSVAFIFRLRCS